MNKIIVNRGSFKLEEIDFTQNALTIGRAADNDIKLDDISVSNHHAKIVKVLNTCYIQDLDSTNGTLVNGKKTHKRSLYSGDVISLGKHQLLYQSDKASSSSKDEDNTMILQPAEIEKSLKDFMHASDNASAKPAEKPAEPAIAQAAPSVAQTKTPRTATPQAQAHEAVRMVTQTPAANTEAEKPVRKEATAGKAEEVAVAEPPPKPAPEPKIPQDYLQHLQAAADAIARQDETVARQDKSVENSTGTQELPPEPKPKTPGNKKGVPETRLILGRRGKAKDKPVIQVDSDRPKPPPYDIPTYKDNEKPLVTPGAEESEEVAIKDPIVPAQEKLAEAAPIINNDRLSGNHPENPAFHGARNMSFTDPKPKKGLLSAVWAVITIALVIEVTYLLYRALG